MLLILNWRVSWFYSQIQVSCLELQHRSCYQAHLEVINHFHHLFNHHRSLSLFSLILLGVWRCCAYWLWQEVELLQLLLLAIVAWCSRSCSWISKVHVLKFSPFSHKFCKFRCLTYCKAYSCPKLIKNQLRILHKWQICPRADFS